MGVDVQRVRKCAIRPGALTRSIGRSGEPLGSLVEVTVVGFAIGAVLALAIGHVPQLAGVIAALVVLLMTGLDGFEKRPRR
jgi:uncharacterized membrane protein YgaE (UPF0421/DUF939 family)